MAVKRTGQLGFGEALLLEGRGRNAALERVAGLVRWDGIEAALTGLREEGPGRPGYRPLLLFKALLLQAWHGLSDAELETALGDRLSFARSVGLSLEDPVPDHTTLCRFRNRLIETGTLERLFAELDGQLEGGRADPQARGDAGRHLDRGRRRPPPPRQAVLRSRRRLRPALGQARSHIWLQGPCGRRRGLGPDPDGADHPGQCERHSAGRRPDPRRRTGGLGRQRLSHPCPAGRDQGAGPEEPDHAAAQPASPRPARAAAAAEPAHRPQARRGETTFATLKRRMGLRRIRYVGLVKTGAQVLLAAMAFNLRRAAAMTA